MRDSWENSSLIMFLVMKVFFFFLDAQCVLLLTASGEASCLVSHMFCFVCFVLFFI